MRGGRGSTYAVWGGRPLFALDADVTTYWPDVRPVWEDGDCLCVCWPTRPSEDDHPFGGTP